MLVPDDPQAARSFRLTSIEDYEPLIGGEAVERMLKKADKLHDLHVVNVNSTYYGGGVAEILSSLTLLMNAAGIRTGWRVIQGRPDFFSITKKMHNALQGGEINLSDLKKCTSTRRWCTRTRRACISITTWSSSTTRSRCR